MVKVMAALPQPWFLTQSFKVSWQPCYSLGSPATILPITEEKHGSPAKREFVI
jgi:hypothetical protein